MAGQSSTQSPSQKSNGKLIIIGDSKGCLFAYYQQIQFQIYRYNEETKKTVCWLIVKLMIN